MPVISKVIKAGKMTKNKLKHKIYLSKSVLNLYFKHVKSVCLPNSSSPF